MRDLWSDGKTEDDMAGVANDEMIYNLFEDIRCLKEEVKHWRDINWKLLDANSSLTDAVKKMIK